VAFAAESDFCVLVRCPRSELRASDGVTCADAQLGRTGECGRWRRTAEELDEAPQVLSDCG
jgi:hypothetical protein